MAARHTLSYALMVIGVVLAILLLVAQVQWTYSILLGVAVVVVGYLFYRRGK